MTCAGTTRAANGWQIWQVYARGTDGGSGGVGRRPGGAVHICLLGFSVNNLVAILLLATAGASVRRCRCLRNAGTSALMWWLQFAGDSCPPWGAPDESALFVSAPGRRLLQQGRGFERVLRMCCASGAVGSLSQFAPAVIGFRGGLLQTVLRLHSHWMLWCLIVFLLMSEWPRGARQGRGAGAAWWTGRCLVGMGPGRFCAVRIARFRRITCSRLTIRLSIADACFVGLEPRPSCFVPVCGRGAPPRQSLEALNHARAACAHLRERCRARRGAGSRSCRG